jgi:hypothetical protein
MANRNSDIANRDSSIKRNPSVRHPWALNPADSGFVWIHINARRILDQYSKGVGTVRVQEGKPEVQFAFLSPLALTEGTIHNWAEYDSIASRIAQKARTAAKLGAEWNGLMKTFRSTTPEDSAKNVLANKQTTNGALISTWVRSAYEQIAPHSIPKLKVDTPLYYESSDRRNLTFEVILIAEDHPKSDLIDPVKDLMKWAAPNLRGRGGITIDFPYMFEVYTQPKKFIKYTTLALTAVQPTWNAPYIGGYPSSCNLQLTFKDLSPLYRSAIEYGSVINVIKTQRTKEKQARGESPVISKHETYRLQKAQGLNTTNTNQSNHEKRRLARIQNASGDPANHPTKGVDPKRTGGAEGDVDAF